jgi:hypothetical protein
LRKDQVPADRGDLCGGGWVEMYRRLKYLGLIVIMLLALYPIAELTRVIIVSGTFYFPEMKGQLVAETTIMWVLYLSIVPVFLLFNNRNIRHLRRLRRENLESNTSDVIAGPLTDQNPSQIPVKFVQ